MELTHSDVTQILEILDEAEFLEELQLTHGEFRLHVRRRGVAEPLSQAAPAPRETTAAPTTKVAANTPAPPAKTAQQLAPDGLVAIRAPMLGTFYRSPSPGEPPFIEVGQRVSPDDTVCLIEVMKLFNSIRAGVTGKIVKILADNAALVEYNEILLLIDPEP